ncbi:MAG: biopolymer transporter ExbD [Bacteroidota bacterium]
MNFGRRKRVHSAVEASSLSDILFFLLLFFLIISTMASPNAIKLLLPKASTGQAISNNAIKLNINASKEYYIDKRRIQMEDLSNQISNEARGKEKPTVVLRMDKSITVEELAKVLDVVNKLKIPLVIAVDKGK